MALRGKKPEITEKRLKLFLYGPAGVGKTTAATQMPAPYIIDTERGTEHKAYVDAINKAGGAVFKTSSDVELLEELQGLRNESHPYKTLVIDPITNIEDNIVNYSIEKYNRQKKNKNTDADEDVDMRVWRDRDMTMRRIRSLITSIDMNVIVTAHSKNIFKPKKKNDQEKVEEITFEGWKKWPFMFDLVLELTANGKRRDAYVVKSRMPDEFGENETFEWSYQELARRYGATEMEREAVAVATASREQIEDMEYLISQLSIDGEWVTKIFKAAGVVCWDDMPADKIQKCIDQQSARLKALNPESEVLRAI